MIDTAANTVVGVVRWGHRRRAWLSTAALLLTLVAATAYLLLGALRVNPFAASHRMVVQLPESGGLLPNQDVTLRGVPIGRVQSLDITPAGVDAHITVDAAIKIPESSAVQVSGLSPAGEQYINFAAESGAGPYLTDGSVIELGRAEVPVLGCAGIPTATAGSAKKSCRRGCGSASRSSIPTRTASWTSRNYPQCDRAWVAAGALEAGTLEAVVLRARTLGTVILRAVTGWQP